MMNEPFTAGRGGTLIWLPSAKMVNSLLGPQPAPHAPVRPGVLQTERSPKPIPSAGVNTIPTPLTRSKARAQPPRNTLLRSPRILPSQPPVNDGFQAAAKRGPKLL